MQQNLRRGIFILFCLAHTLTALPQVTATVVKDIAPEWRSSDPAFLTVYNNELYFRANDNTFGRELWKTDGTAAGTVMVKDINPGSSGSDPEWLTVSNGILYFTANNGINGGELWRSDGTAAGTQMVKDIMPGSAHTYPGSLADVNGVLYFAVTTTTIASGTRGLWKTDGTEAGTQLVAGPVGSDVSVPSGLVNVNGTLYFIDYWSSLPVGTTLLKSDGTEAGTVRVSNNAGRFPFGIGPAYLAAFNNEVYFEAKVDGEGGGGLWKSDGTDAGTVMVKDMNSSNFNGGAQFITNINNTLYFTGHNGSANAELWKSDGTEAGTVLVKDINAGAAGSSPQSFIYHKGLIYFTATTAAYGREIWQTDGTESGTSLVADLYEGAGSPISFIHELRGMVSMNDNLYFVATLDNNLGQELYKLSETILPVVWETMDIDCKDGLPVLYWKTATEINTSDFIVQASADAVNWINADTVAAVGNSNTSVAYRYTENNTRGNYRYYRVIQRDMDGKSTYSKVLNISCGRAVTRLSVFPNPANNTITLTGIENRDINRVEIFNMAGRRLMTSANKQATVDISALSKGLYVLKLVKKDAGTVSRKFIKQ